MTKSEKLIGWITQVNSPPKLLFNTRKTIVNITQKAVEPVDARVNDPLPPGVTGVPTIAVKFQSNLWPQAQLLPALLAC